MDKPLPRGPALFLFAVIVLTWGTTWVATKLLVQSVPPLWTTAIRSGIAAAALFPLLAVRGQLILPPRSDIPVVLAVAILHMVAFAVLVAFGLKLVPLERSIVLGYTTPLWVLPGAWLFLGEPLTKWRLTGGGIGLMGLLVMFNPAAFDWNNHDALLGNGLVLLAAFCWAANILYLRAHKWTASPLQLVLWQALLATAILAAAAYAVDGAPQIAWDAALVLEFLYAGIVGVALAYWAMSVVNRSLPAVTTSLGILATPVVGVICSVFAFGEPITPSLVVSMTMIACGIAIGTVPIQPRSPTAPGAETASADTCSTAE
jgi:drug/metabolite transporter (DMT)-like permease